MQWPWIRWWSNYKKDQTINWVAPWALLTQVEIWSYYNPDQTLIASIYSSPIHEPTTPRKRGRPSSTITARKDRKIWGPLKRVRNRQKGGGRSLTLYSTLWRVALTLGRRNRRWWTLRKDVLGNTGNWDLLGGSVTPKATEASCHIFLKACSFVRCWCSPIVSQCK